MARTERLSLDQSILQVEEDLDNQRVIAADAVRTRSNELRFQAPETVELVVKLLTYYCKCRSIQYKQGMNEVLAPFLLLTEQRDGCTETSPLADGVVYQCFYALIDRFLPHVFVDKEFRSLQCSLQLFRLLMLYHDPELCHYLDQHDMTPELYVTPWFITLFARSLPPEYVFYLWDFFLLEKDSDLPHFVAYALVVAHRGTIIQADVAMLPQVLSSLTFSSRDELEQVCADALLISKSTPKSFKRDLFSVCHGDFTEKMVPFLDRLSAFSCLQVYPEELVQNLMNHLTIQSKKKQPTSGGAMQQEPLKLNSLLSPMGDQDYSNSSGNDDEDEAKAIKFILLDCRPAREYRKSHLSLSHHIDPSIMERPDALDRLMTGFACMKGCHFCFVGPSVDSLSVSSKSLSKKTGLNPITRLTSVMSNDKSAREPNQKIHTVHGAAEKMKGVSLLTSPLRGPVGFGESGAVSSNISSLEASLFHAEHVSVTRIVLMFLQKGFKYVSRLDGGFDMLEKSIQTMDMFAQEQLLVSSPFPVLFPEPVMDSTDSVRNTTTGGFNLLTRIGLNKLRSPSQDEPATGGEFSTCSEGSGLKSGRSKLSTPVVLSAFNSNKSSKNAKDGTLKPQISTSGTVSALSQRLTLMKAAGRDAVPSSSNFTGRENKDALAKSIDSADESPFASEEGWVDVRVQKSSKPDENELTMTDVELQSGPIGILFQKSRTSKSFQAVVDSVVPDTQASASGLINSGDLLVAVNGVSLEKVPFLKVIDRIIEASRPVMLRFLAPATTIQEKAHDVATIPPLAPSLVCATRHSLCITWDNMAVPVTSASVARYQVQFAKQSGDEETCWLPVAMKQEGTRAEVDTTGITDQTNGTMVGLEPDESLAFRVRCGNGQQWGPYSLPSGYMKTLKIDSSSSVSETITPTSITRQDVFTAIFLPGVCPKYVERGHFFYRVLLPLQARRRPDFYAEKLNIVLEKGFVVRGLERLVCPGTNQVFVRLDETNDTVNQDELYEQAHELNFLRNEHWEANNDTTGIWAFENTPNGDVVLERLSGAPDDAVAPSFRHQAKSLVQSFLHSSGLSQSNSTGNVSRGDNTGFKSAGSINLKTPFTASDSKDSKAGLSTHAPIAPHDIQAFATSSSEVVVTWDPVKDVDVTKYQIQYAKDRLAAMWWTVKPDIAGDTLKSSVSGLQPNTPYHFRIRSGTNDNKWSPYSEPSKRCCTLQSGNNSANNSSSEDDDKVSVSQGSSSSIEPTLLEMTSRPPACESAPMRTGSTILDKTVAVALRLKRHSNNPQMTIHLDGTA